jgi:hypothetical protein
MLQKYRNRLFAAFCTWIQSYGRALHSYNSASSLVHFLKQHFLKCFLKNAPVYYNIGVVCSCKLRNRRNCPQVHFWMHSEKFFPVLSVESCDNFNCSFIIACSKADSVNLFQFHAFWVDELERVVYRYIAMFWIWNRLKNLPMNYLIWSCMACM